MKKILTLFAVLLLVLALSGCNPFGPTAEMKEDPFPYRDKPQYSEEPTIYIELLADGTQRYLTPYHETIRAAKDLMRKAEEMHENIQNITPQQYKTLWSKAYLEFQYERFGEPFYELNVRDKQERNMVWTTDAVIRHIILTPDGAVTVGYDQTITFTSGNFEGLNFSHELNKPDFQPGGNARMVFENGYWRVDDVWFDEKPEETQTQN